MFRPTSSSLGWSRWVPSSWGADVLERRQVADDVPVEPDGVDVEVLVALVVLQIDQGVGGVGPGVIADAALLVGGDDPGVLVAEGLDPDLQDVVLVGSEEGEAFAVGGDLRGGLDGIAEQDGAGDERGQRGAAGGRRRQDSQAQDGQQKRSGHGTS